ncbi:MAG: trehalose-phosphatase [Euzebya sp.]
MCQMGEGFTSQWPAADPSQACLVLDFDGSLAPIVADPSESSLPRGTAEVLTRLVSGLGRVAIVSGRPGSFLLNRVTVAGVHLMGLYGLERVSAGQVIGVPGVQEFLGALHRARDDLVLEVARWPGAELEDKGLAVAVHWRRAARPEEAGRALSAVVRSLAGELAVEDGKMVVELRPPLAADKGTAVAQLADGFAEVAFAGDDLGDLPGFAEVSRRGGVAIVVDHGSETDPRVRDAATIVVAGTQGLAGWLSDIAARIGV